MQISHFLSLGSNVNMPIYFEIVAAAEIMDYELFQTINGLAGKFSLLDELMKGLTLYGPFISVAVLAVLLLRWKMKEFLTGILGFAAMLTGLGMDFLIGVLFYRGRPFVEHHVNLLLQHTQDSSFPSDHTTATFAIAFAVWKFNQKLSSLLLILASIIGVSRIYVGHHYPTDVLGGILIGFLSVKLVLWLFNTKGFSAPVKTNGQAIDK
ncbi:phosphatase PAP2 family protein [Effusibacillus consociatus]|uniref:Phosphatase PAP2 family protein n=1 Tax=Effusibacillus consociatus TaxID=1117041 RepID=A0ABV9Q7U6_9BACL